MTHFLKSVMLVVCVCILSTTLAWSQSRPKATPNQPVPQTSKKVTTKSSDVGFRKGSKVLNLGLGLSVYNYANSSFFPALSASVDVGFKEGLGPGTLGLGGMVGYWQSSYNLGSSYKSTWRNIMVAARGTYHFDALNTEKYDVYVGALAGLRSYSFNANDTFLDLNESYIRPAIGFFGGGRYHFSKGFGVFGEAGYGMSWLTVGAALKL